MKNNGLLIWVSDLSENTGEGILAREFLAEIGKLTNYKKIKIKTLEQEIFVKKINIKNIKIKKINGDSLFHRYFGPIYGAIYLLLFSRRYQTAYLNYLPLWNFLIFFILPRKTILGPITGGDYKNSAYNINLMIRKYLFPIFYQISIFLISKKFNKIIFSTSILKPYLKKNNLHLFNFVIMLFNKKITKRKKKYDIIFYNRNHATKHTTHVKKLLISLSGHLKICVIGDFFYHNNIVNFGWVTRAEAGKLIGKSKLAFNSTENFLTIFGIDCVNYGTPVVFDKNLKSPIKLKNNSYIGVNFDNLETAHSAILGLLSENNKKKDTMFWHDIITKKNSIKKFFSSYLSFGFFSFSRYQVAQYKKNIIDAKYRK